MKIVMTGAGSGGHITPILAVAHEIKKQNSSAEIIYIGQTGDKLINIPKNNPDIDRTFSVHAGKFRRYHGSGAKQLLQLQTASKNIKDSFKVFSGLAASYRILGKIKPDLVFVSGYMGVPVGLAAKFRHIPYVVHDSDKSLTNKIVGPWAKVQTTALENADSTNPDIKVVGVPVSEKFKLVTDAEKIAYRKDLDIRETGPILFVIGGGLGAKAINNILIDILPDLLKEIPDLMVIHFSGLANEEEVVNQYAQRLSAEQKERVIVHGYATDLYKYSGAADLIVTRAGATNLAEFEVQGKACIVIPNPVLVGGHQLKNAKILDEKGAIRLLTEDEIHKNSDSLIKTIVELLSSEKERNKLEQTLRSVGHPDAAKKIAEILIEQVNE